MNLTTIKKSSGETVRIKTNDPENLNLPLADTKYLKNYLKYVRREILPKDKDSLQKVEDSRVFKMKNTLKKLVIVIKELNERELKSGVTS